MLIDHDHCHKEIASLREQLENAHATIDYLKGLLLPMGVPYPPSFHMTKVESRILDVLRATKGAANIERFAAICGRPSLKVHMSRLRSRLQSIDVRLEAIWGDGYYISEEDKQKINDAIRDKKELLTRKQIDNTYKRRVGYVAAV